MRLSRDAVGIALAQDWALRGTCKRRQVGCVLFDADGVELSSGYNGPASGEPHCIDFPCPGAGLKSGEGLELCEAIHAEANALLKCPDVRRIHTAYITHSPCLHCVKLLKNTGCFRIVFLHPYAHDEASRAFWIRGNKWYRMTPIQTQNLGPRRWEQYQDA